MTRVSATDHDLERWVDEGRRVIIDIADMLGVPPEVYSTNPLLLIPALQNYVDRLPLEEFEQSDWVTLQADLMSYVGDFLIRTHGARWRVVEDSATPRGYRYVIEAEGRDGETRAICPVDVVRAEFGDPPIDITRMLAGAELTLRLSSPTGETE